MINISRDIRLSLGRSMIEMLGVLAIIGVLSIGGLYAYRQAMNRYKANEILDAISKIQFGTLDLCPDKNNCNIPLYDDIKNELLLTAPYFKGYLPEDWLTRRNSSESWPQIPVTPKGNWFLYTFEGTYFYLQLRNIPDEICAQIVSKPFPKLRRIEVGATSFGGSEIVNNQLSPAQVNALQTACNGNQVSPGQNYAVLLIGW